MTTRTTRMLWFDHLPEDAASLYVAIFGNSGIRDSWRSGDAGPGPKGMVPGVGQCRGSER